MAEREKSFNFEVKSGLKKLTTANWSLCCSRVGIFLVLFGFCFYLESMGSMYIITAIQSMERQFKISSKTSGSLVSAHEIGYLPTVVVLSYLGSRGNRARWIGGGCLLMAIGNVLISLPGFAFPNKPNTVLQTNDSISFPESFGTGPLGMTVTQQANLRIGYCSATVNRIKEITEEEKCKDSSSNGFGVAMIFLALILVGIGHSVPWSLGVPLIDDNVKRKSMPIFFALLFLLKVMGPVSGLFIGGAVNKIYTTLKQPIGLTPLDPHWIGAWWLGYLIVGVMLIWPSLGLCFFPNDPSKELEVQADESGENKPKMTRQTSVLLLTDKHLKEDDQLETRFVPIVKKFGHSVLEILRSPVYTGAVIGKVADAFSFKGFFTFLPKFLDNHYGLPQHQSSMYIGIIGLFGFAFGVLVGSMTMRRLKLDGRRAAAWVGVCSLISAVIAVSKIGLGCHSVVNNIGKIGMGNQFNFTQSCNTDCYCDPVKLLPVCSESGEAFYSPCHAGCRNMTLADPTSFKMKFGNCSCLGGSDSSVSRDWCEDNCGLMIWLYFLLLGLGSFVGALSVIPGMLIVLRAVPPEHRSISMGLSAFIVSLGTLAAPVFYGAVIDSACLNWEQTCEGTGSCSIYEPTKLRIRIHLVMGVLKFIGLLFDVWVWYFAKDLKVLAEDDPTSSNERKISKDGLDMQQF